MSRYERYETRDLTFSRWHRYALTDRVTAIDLDMIEYCRRCRMPLALIETARDIGQPRKPAPVMREVARLLNVVAWTVLYTPTAEPCRCNGRFRIDGCVHGIEAMRIQQVHPTDVPFEDWQPGEFGARLTLLHDNHEEIICRYRRPA
jgi:hypothetical protein